MTLQQLLGELITLSNAYPDDTPITLLIGEDQHPLESVAVDSGAKVEIYLRDS